MDSEFDSFMAAGLDDMLDTTGGKDFIIAGTTYKKAGILNEFTSAKELEIAGFMGKYDGTVMAKRSIFTEATNAKLERNLDGEQLTMEGRVFRIKSVSIDETSVTMGLTHTG